MSSNLIVSVPKLKGRENYDEWAFAAENLLILEGLEKHISEAVESSTAQLAESDKKARAKLILTIDPSTYVHIKEANTTLQLWQKLMTMYDDSGFTRRISLLRSLISTRLEDCDSMEYYVNQIVEIGQKLRGTGVNVDDVWTGSLLLAGLSDK